MEDTPSSSEPQIEDDDDLYEYLESVVPAPDDFSENYDADCVRKTGNFASSDSRYLFDYTSPKDERKVLTRERLQYVSPKLLTLLDEIERQDHADIAEFGRTFKHFIFSSIKSGTGGAKIIATALIDLYDMTLGYSVQNRKLAFLQENSIDGSNGTFYLLSSVGVFGKPIPVPMRKEILKKFNSRPDNVHGDVSRIIIMDSGFKEGVDLFDVKYVHIFEPQTTFADQKQAIGRATRTCGQKGLEFQPNRGWQLHVNIYDSVIPEVVSFKYKDSRSVHEMYLKALGIDVRMLNLVSDMENLYAKGAVDHDLNVPIHDFGNSERNAGSKVEDYAGSKVLVEDLTDSGSKVSVEDLNMHGGKKMALSDSKRRAIEEMLIAKGANGNRKLINALVLPKYKGKTVKPVPIIQNKNLEQETLDLLNLTRDAKLIGVLQGLKRTPDSLGEPETYEEMREYIKGNYSHEYKWADAKLENLCPSDDQAKDAKETSSTIHFNKTQNFVRRYFTPDLVNHKGILLAHSVGTGKTCTAIATATTSFEREGYTILWVTRTTLKTDIWKNMFDQICSDSLRQVGSIPSAKDPKARMRLLSKAWSIRPMSYKQFSNLVSGKNSMYQALVKRNGTLDPLRKTLLIIDEAHKLYGETDLSAIERPDMAAFHESVMRSYEVSGADSVRLMLMTATPITSSPMEFVKLMNLCKERPRQMETEFAAFSQEYLDGAGRFTGVGETRFLDEIAGYVSYLNREKDARVFAQPIIKRVDVPLLPQEGLFEDYDAPLIRALEKPRIAEMEAQVKRDLEKIEKATQSFKGITAKSFDRMKLLCDNANVKTKKAKSACKKAATQTIKEIVAYVKERKSETKDLTKEVKESLRDFKRTLKEKTDKINERVRSNKGTRKVHKSSEEEMRNSAIFGGSRSKTGLKERPIEDIDTDYQRYIQSAFHGIKSKCRIPAKRTVFESHPTIMELRSDIQGLRDAAKTKDKDAKLFAKNIRIQMKGLSEGPETTNQKNDLKMQIKTMTIEKRKEIAKINEKIAKKEKFTRKLKQLLERKYKKSVKDRAKMEKDIANDVAEIDEESGELKKKVKEIHDLADIEDDELREFVKAKTQEFVEGLSKQ